MGRRARRRADAPAPPAPAARRPGRLDERPRAPWHPFPLVELCALLGLVLLVLGLLDLDSSRGRTFLLAGMAIGSLAGLETALREHFTGFRSHSTVLAGVPAVALAAALFFLDVPWPALVLAAIATFAGSFALLRRAHRRRGG
jgi:hypothetical protein